jgi:hypothetical protein
MRPYGARWFYRLLSQDFILGYSHPLPPGVAYDGQEAE